MHAYRFGTIGERRNGNQHIIQRRYKKNGKAENAHDITHPFHTLIVPVCIADRLYKRRISIFRFTLFRTVLLYHSVYTCVHHRLVRTGTETDIFRITVPALP